MITDEQIKKGLDKAYEEAGHNPYFGNGFQAGVKFAQEQVKNCSIPDVIYYVSEEFSSSNHTEFIDAYKTKEEAQKEADKFNECCYEKAYKVRECKL